MKKKKKKKRIQIRYEKILEIKDDAEFKLQTGLKREVFFKILDFLTEKFNKAHERGSFKGIGVGCRFVLALTYWREYRAMRQMGFDYDVSASTVCDSIKWIEEALQDFPDFQIEDIKTEIEKLEAQGVKVESIIGDVEEQPIERPTINQEESYSGKKKRHTTKNQIIIVEDYKRIINYYNKNGTVHDFKMLKDSGILTVLEEKKISGKFDSGYQGVQKELSKAIIPKKKSKLHELTNEEKEFNRQLSQKRIAIEHVNRELKIFRIMKETYRNHQNRYQQKLKIMCGIFNLNNS